MAEMNVVSSTNATAEPFYILCDSIVGFLQSENTGWNPQTQSSVLVSVISESEAPPCDSADAGLAGWSIQSALPDGGEIAGPTGWPVAYLGPSGLATTGSGTLSDGYGIIYNIDASVDSVAVYVNGGPPGVSCPNSNAALGLDGVVHVQPGGFGMFPYVIP